MYIVVSFRVGLYVNNLGQAASTGVSIDYSMNDKNLTT